jgi:hypothetical protein
MAVAVVLRCTGLATTEPAYPRHHPGPRHSAVAEQSQQRSIIRLKIVICYPWIQVRARAPRIFRATLTSASWASACVIWSKGRRGSRAAWKFARSVSSHTLADTGTHTGISRPRLAPSSTWGSSTSLMNCDARNEVLTRSTATLDRSICSSIRVRHCSPGTIDVSTQTSISSRRISGANVASSRSSQS